MKITKKQSESTLKEFNNLDNGCGDNLCAMKKALSKFLYLIKPNQIIELAKLRGVSVNDWLDVHEVVPEPHLDYLSDRGEVVKYDELLGCFVTKDGFTRRDIQRYCQVPKP